MRVAKLTLGILLSTAISGIATAEDTGRLSDGRAFRTDTNGYRLVDELAELQVSNEELRRQVNSLADELSQKNTSLQSKGACPIQPQTPLIKTETVKLPCDCLGATAPLQNKILELQSRIEQSSAQFERAKLSEQNLTNSLAKVENSLAAEKSSRQASVSEAQKALNDAITSASATSEAQAKAISLRDAKISQLEQQLAGLQTQLSQSQSELAKKSAEVKLAATQAATRATQKDAPQEFSAPRLKATAPAYVPTTPQVQFSAKKELGEIQSLIVKRKDLFDALTAKRRGVMIKLQPLKTAAGQSLDSLRSASAAVSSAEQARNISSGLQEIRTVLLDDITTIQRLAK